MTKEELEKEIRKYLKKTFHHEYYDDVVKVMGFAEPRENRITDLEKENAELKSIADFQQSGNMSRYFELKRQAEKLEEAKELLKKLLVHSKRYIWIADDNNKPIMQKEIAEAEQFLSEVEKCGQ